MLEIELAGEIRQGEPLYFTGDSVSLPQKILEPYELVYRILNVPGFILGDVIICEPRNRARTGELVLGIKGQLVFVGRWWAKHGLKQLLAGGEVIEDCKVAGSINQIVRYG